MNGIMDALKSSPIGGFMNAMSLYNQMNTDPTQIGRILFDSGRINQSQLDEIQKLNGKTEQIGRYLLQSGALAQNTYNQFQSAAPQVQGMLKGF